MEHTEGLGEGAVPRGLPSALIKPMTRGLPSALVDKWSGWGEGAVPRGLPSAKRADVIKKKTALAGAGWWASHPHPSCTASCAGVVVAAELVSRRGSRPSGSAMREVGESVL